MFPPQMMQLMGLLQNNNGGNPMQLINQMLGNNPLLQRATQMAQGKTPAQMQQIVRNLAAQRGISPQQINQMIAQFGLKI